jgi:hypothetical protein
LNEIEAWIDQTNANFKDQRICFAKFVEKFEGFYSLEFLQRAYYVVVSTIPKPDFPELREMNLGDFIDMDVQGITYKNTYYILPHSVNDLSLHFHELVHVAQCSELGAIPFMQRYINEIQIHGYDEAPLEKMAYELEARYSSGAKKIDIAAHVSKII